MKFRTRFPALTLLACSGIAVACQGAERPTFNHNTRDPRPDILPYSLHQAIPEYRRVYNRPRFLSGWIAHTIAPTSQEAMVWCENYHAGAYDQKHSPPRYKRYFGPKPWEALQTGARPDFPQPEPLVPSPMELRSGDEQSSPESAYPSPRIEADTPRLSPVPDPYPSSRGGMRLRHSSVPAQR